jgi:hypothetical protein
MGVTSAANGRKSNGAKTAAGKLTIIRARTTNGIRSCLPVLAGIEDPVEYEKFHQGFTAAWQPVGTHEAECVRHLAHCYWRLRRATRFESEATLAELLAQARCEDDGVQQQIEELLGVTIEAHEGENEDSLSEWASPAWWQQILSGPDELELTQAQALELFSYVLERVLEQEDEDSEDEDEDARPDVQLPAGPTTLGALRAQLEELGSLLEPDRPSPFEILEQKYELAVYEDTNRKQDRMLAHQFISRYLLLPLDRHTTLINERRQVLSEISRHMNILERLQAKRLGEPVLAPVSLDVNVTGRVAGEGD